MLVLSLPSWNNLWQSWHLLLWCICYGWVGKLRRIFWSVHIFLARSIFFCQVHIFFWSIWVYYCWDVNCGCPAPFFSWQLVCNLNKSRASRLCSEKCDSVLNIVTFTCWRQCGLFVNRSKCILTRFRSIPQSSMARTVFPFQTKSHWSQSPNLAWWTLCCSGWQHDSDTLVLSSSLHCIHMSPYNPNPRNIS